MGSLTLRAKPVSRRVQSGGQPGPRWVRPDGRLPVTFPVLRLNVLAII
jgi:hypothetical protein